VYIIPFIIIIFLFQSSYSQDGEIVQELQLHHFQIFSDNAHVKTTEGFIELLERPSTTYTNLNIYSKADEVFVKQSDSDVQPMLSTEKIAAENDTLGQDSCNIADSLPTQLAPACHSHQVTLSEREETVANQDDTGKFAYIGSSYAIATKV